MLIKNYCIAKTDNGVPELVSRLEIQKVECDDKEASISDVIN